MWGRFEFTPVTPPQVESGPANGASNVNQMADVMNVILTVAFPGQQISALIWLNHQNSNQDQNMPHLWKAGKCELLSWQRKCFKTRSEFVIAGNLKKKSILIIWREKKRQRLKVSLLANEVEVQD